MSVMVVGMTHASPAVKTSFNPAVDPKIAADIRRLAAPMLEPKSPKDPTAIAEIFRLVQVNEIQMSDLPSLTGLSAKVLHHYAQARTSSGRHWPGMREALDRVGIPVKPKAPPKRQIGVGVPWPPPVGVQTVAAPLPSVPVGKARKKQGKKAAKVAAAVAPKPERKQPVAPVAPSPVTAPAPKAPVVSAGNVEIHEDGTITLTLHPGDPGYAETLRGLLASRVA